MIYLNDVFTKALSGQDPVAALEAMDGQVYRQLEGRSTRRIEVGNKGYFVKIHRGVGWGEIIKNLAKFRAPVISAENEWHALQRLRALDVDTMVVAAYGKSGWNPARMQSFLVTEELTDTVSLEDFCAHWAQQPPSFRLKRQLIEKIAQISRSLHGHGICHRDYYLCHFLLHRDSLDGTAEQAPRLSLIDLHRALVKTRLGQRWIEKDLAGLYFSSMDAGLTQRDRLRFIRVYSGMPLRESLGKQRDFWLSVQRKAQALYQKLTSRGK